jgi:hypothetical protein
MPKGDIMRNKDKNRDPLPETFSTEEEAGEFWDTHSTMDYEEYLEPSEDEIEIKQRIFEVQVEADVFLRLQQEARSLNESVPKVVDHILRERLTMPES